MPPLNSRVWRRYGQLRIYVSADNDPVGWFDPRTGRSHLSRPGRHGEFWAAVRAECQQLLRDGQISASALPPEVSPTAQWEAPAAWSAGRLLHRATGLEVPVQSAIVFVGARQVTVRRGGPADVAVLPNPRALRRWLYKQPPALRTDQVEAIYEAARRPASWQSG
jgi:hypothetical protein